jgi:hypothetical protein
MMRDVPRYVCVCETDEMDPFRDRVARWETIKGTIVMKTFTSVHKVKTPHKESSGTGVDKVKTPHKESLGKKVDKVDSHKCQKSQDAS